MSIPTPEQVALARRRYIEGTPVGAIVAEIGATSLRIAYGCFDGEFPDGSGISPAPIPRRRSGVRLFRSGSRRTALVKRLWRAAEQQVDQIEQRLKDAGLELNERDGNARALAVLVKTLRELVAFDQATAAKTRKASDDGDDDAVPTDLEELRRELARRIEALAEVRADGGSEVPGES
jgi:hypothetical protein